MPKADCNRQALASLVIIAEKCLIRGTIYVQRQQRQKQIDWTCLLSTITSTSVCFTTLSL